jgi:hypothetical protein
MKLSGILESIKDDGTDKTISHRELQRAGQQSDLAYVGKSPGKYQSCFSGFIDYCPDRTPDGCIQQAIDQPTL